MHLFKKNINQYTIADFYATQVWDLGSCFWRKWCQYNF